MKQLMNALHQDHQQITVLLTILKNKLVTLQQGGKPNFALMAEVVDYLQDYAGSFHHEKEDHLYHYLRAHYPDTATVISQQFDEHRELAQLTHALARTIDAALMDAPVSLSDFSRQLSRFIDKQSHHLSQEENKVFPLIQRTLSRDEWHAVSQQLPQRDDPLASAGFEARYRHLAQALIEDLA
ncbi:hemerythrin domain-containing protein [Motiliproteus sediminis]|uniref:hemerythrin domain-containing protein n=1 Tax=Motiliproteus sediminis TaxID=1468178 RepID=UPI001AEFACDF|nr:hemerythrin domain-containing protein [Motiliproteus sediminis]